MLRDITMLLLLIFVLCGASVATEWAESEVQELCCTEGASVPTECTESEA